MAVSDSQKTATPVFCIVSCLHTLGTVYPEMGLLLFTAWACCSLGAGWRWPAVLMSVLTSLELGCRGQTLPSVLSSADPLSARFSLKMIQGHRVRDQCSSLPKWQQGMASTGMPSFFILCIARSSSCWISGWEKGAAIALNRPYSTSWEDKRDSIPHLCTALGLEDPGCKQLGLALDVSQA